MRFPSWVYYGWISDTACDQNHLAVCCKVWRHMAYFWLLSYVWCFYVASNVTHVRLHNGSRSINRPDGHFFNISKCWYQLVWFCMHYLIMVNTYNGVMWGGTKTIPEEVFLDKTQIYIMESMKKRFKFEVLRL